MSEHLDSDALADVLAGLDQPAHLEGCADCQAALSQLSAAMASVTVALAQLPEPVVPAGLEARLVAALAKERRATAVPSAATVTPLSTARSSRRRWLAPAGGIAAAAVLVTGGVLLLGGSSPSRHATSTQADGIARNETGTDYTSSGAALKADVLALLKGNAPAAASALAAAPSVGGTTSDSAAVPGAQAPDRNSSKAASVDPLAALRTTAGLAGCLASLSDPTDPGVPLALDYATFAGQPSLLVLLPGAKKGVVEAFFVGAGCAQADSHLLFFQKLTP